MPFGCAQFVDGGTALETRNAVVDILGMAVAETKADARQGRKGLEITGQGVDPEADQGCQSVTGDLEAIDALDTGTLYSLLSVFACVESCFLHLIILCVYCLENFSFADLVGFR